MSRKLTPKGEASRQQIIEAAYRLFLDKGFSATSIRDISKACDLTIGGVYTHFAGKDEIFTAVLNANHPILAAMDAIGEAQGDSADALFRDAAHRMVAALGTHREALNLLFTEIVEFQGRHFSEMFPAAFPKMVGFIQRVTVLNGSLRPIPMPILARSFFGLFFSYFMTIIALPPHFTSDDQALDTFVDIYLYGILINKDIPVEDETQMTQMDE